MLKRLLVPVGILFLITLMGCDSHVASTKTDLQGACWGIADTLSLSFEAPDPTAQYQVVLPLTVTEEYPFNNLHIRFEAQAPSGKVSVVPYEYELMDVQGNWYGKASGSKASFELPLSMGQQFGETGVYTFRVWQYFQEKTLCGVETAGIFVNEAE